MKVGPTNQSILQTDLSNYLDTLHDISREDDSKRQGLQKLIGRITIRPAAWPNSFELIQLPHAIRWHPALAEYGASATPLHDVYLVSIPQWDWLTSFKHWSVYSQGSFFHLVLREDGPHLQIDTFTMEQLKSELSSIKWQVQRDNVHRLNAHGARNRHIPMIAYNIGQTQFNVTQMKGLAQFIFNAFDKYTKHEKNCQLFALSLATRVLMTKGVGTIFVGTRAQIAHWDIMATIGEQSSPYNQEEGFLLRAPSHGLSNRSRRYFFNLPGLFADLGYTGDARAIRSLYLHGPYYPGSFDPYGRHALTLRYVLAPIPKSLREGGRDIVKAVKEFSQDIAHGEITNAVRGRHASNLRLYERAVISARKGDRITLFLLPFHKTVLSISDKDAREVHIRLKNRETGLEDREEDVSNCC